MAVFQTEVAQTTLLIDAVTVASASPKLKPFIEIGAPPVRGALFVCRNVTTGAS